MFDLDGNIKLLDFSKVMSQHDMIKNSLIRHGEDVDFNSKEFSTLEKQILYNSNKADIEKYIDLVGEKI